VWLGLAASLVAAAALLLVRFVHLSGVMRKPAAASAADIAAPGIGP
jgi:hypothetical protein